MVRNSETDQSLAPKIGVSRVHVSRLRRSVHKPSPELAVKLESVTGIPAWELLRPTDARAA
jgi:transcriptional regulator with XRE-family HTH domain